MADLIPVAGAQSDLQTAQDQFIAHIPSQSLESLRLLVRRSHCACNLEQPLAHFSAALLRHSLDNLHKLIAVEVREPRQEFRALLACKPRKQSRQRTLMQPSFRSERRVPQASQLPVIQQRQKLLDEARALLALGNPQSRGDRTSACHSA